MQRTVNAGWWRAAAVSALLPLLAGCSGFFVPVNGGGGGGSGGSTGNYVYVANAGRNSVSGFAIGAASTGAGTLKQIANSPLPLGYQPAAMAVAPSNKFLYVAGPRGINVYAINANGSLSTPSAGSTVAIATVVSLAISPDGNWLIGLDGIQEILDVFEINTVTGGLAATQNAQYPVSQVNNGLWVPRMVRFSPNGAMIFAALGTAGDAVFTFNTTTGVAAWAQQSLTLNTATSDNALAVDNNSAYLYIARSGVGSGVAVYSIASSGQLNPVKGSPFPAGTQTFSVALDKAGANVYAANRGDSTISGYSIGAGAALTGLSGSPYTSGLQVTALGADSTGKYLLAAANGGSPDLTMYSFDATTPGKLVAAASIATDTSPANAVAIALTH